MRIRANVNLAEAAANRVVDVDDDVAKRYIDKGWAERVNKTDPVLPRGLVRDETDEEAADDHGAIDAVPGPEAYADAHPEQAKASRSKAGGKGNDGGS